MQNTLCLVTTLKSPADYDALVAILPILKGQVDNAFAQLKTVHFARVVFLDDNTKVAVITEFDGDFDNYVRDFAQALGPVFDTLFAHTVEAPPDRLDLHRSRRSGASPGTWGSRPYPRRTRGPRARAR